MVIKSFTYFYEPWWCGAWEAEQSVHTQSWSNNIINNELVWMIQSNRISLGASTSIKWRVSAQQE